MISVIPIWRTKYIYFGDQIELSRFTHIRVLSIFILRSRFSAFRLHFQKAYPMLLRTFSATKINIFSVFLRKFSAMKINIFSVFLRTFSAMKINIFSVFLRKLSAIIINIFGVNFPQFSRYITLHALFMTTLHDKTIYCKHFRDNTSKIFEFHVLFAYKNIYFKNIQPSRTLLHLSRCFSKNIHGKLHI